MLSSLILIENLNTKEEGSSPFPGRSQTNLRPKNIETKKKGYYKYGYELKVGVMEGSINDAKCLL